MSASRLLVFQLTHILSRGRTSTAKRDSLLSSTARSSRISQKINCYSRTRSYSLKLYGLRSILVKVSYHCKAPVKVITNNRHSLTFFNILRLHNDQLHSDCQLQRRTALELQAAHLAGWPLLLRDSLRSRRHLRLRCDEVLVRAERKRIGIGRGKVRVTKT